MGLSASIIITTYNSSRITIECIEKVIKYTKGIKYEIIIVDNGSRDGFTEELKNLKTEKPQNTKVIENRKNLGYSKANNAGARLACGKFLVFLNNDVIVTPNWLDLIIKFLEKNLEVACVQPKIRSQIQREYFDYAGGAGGYLDILAYPFTRGRVFTSVEKDYGQYDNPVEIIWATGSCMVIERRIFLETHGFDNNFFAYQEEIDLCLRLKYLGYKHYCLPQSLVYHLGAAASNKNLPQKIYLNHLNGLYLFFKHNSILTNLHLVFIRIGLDFLSVFYYMVEGNWAFVVSLARVYWTVLVEYKRFSKVMTLFGRSLSSVPGIYKNSIVFDYFILRKRDFASIMGKIWKKKKKYKSYREVTYFEKNPD